MNEIGTFTPLPYGWWNIFKRCTEENGECSEPCPGIITTEDGHFFATNGNTTGAIEIACELGNYSETVFNMGGAPV